MVEGLWTVILLALLPGAGNFSGAMAAEFLKPSPLLLNWALHAAAGVIIGIVAVELLPEALASIAGWWIASAFALGGVGYLLLEGMVERLQRARSGQRRRIWMVYASVAIDLTSDGLMLGTGAAISPGLAFALSAGQVLADLPEGFATVAVMRQNGIAKPTRLALSTSFFVYPVGAAAASYYLLRAAPQSLQSGALIFVAGLLTVAAVEDMLEEAHDAHADSRRSVMAFVGGFALFTLISAGLESLIAA